MTQNKKIYFYNDLYITKKILISFLKSINDYDEKTKPNVQIPYKLLKILNNNSLLNDLFLYTYENNKSNVYIDEETEEERNKPNSSFNLFKLKVIQELIDMIFTKGSPFYVSNIQKENKNSTSKINYSSYSINHINNLNYITKELKDDEIKWKSLVEPSYFYGNEMSDGKIKGFNENGNENGNKTNSILTKKIKKENNRYISYQGFEDEVKKLDEDKTIVIIDFDLIPTSLIDAKPTCKTRKKRIKNKLWDLFQKNMRKANIFTRKYKNIFKNTRKKRKKLMQK